MDNKEIINETLEEKNEGLDFDPEKKVTVRSIAGWTTGFRRIETTGDVTIPPHGTVRLNASEVIAQVQNGNTLFNGTDAQGSHATLYIDDKATRVEANYELDSKTSKQKFLSKEIVSKMFELKTQKAFEDNVMKNVATRAEKAFLMDTIKELKINDYEKIAFCIDYTGVRP